jgi:hypothetical protein
LISVGSEVQILPGPPSFNWIGNWSWGRSSAGRAPALQAGGRRFEPDRLHQFSRTGSEGGRSGRSIARSVGIRYCWRRVETALVVPVVCPSLGTLIFVRVNQVLVRFWARSVAKSDRMVGGFFPCTSSGREGSEARKVPLCPHGCVLPGRVRWILLCAEQMIPSCAETGLVPRIKSGGKSEDGFCAWWQIPGSSPGTYLEHEKGVRWMPWHQEAMKDVARCEKPWGAASRR